MKKAKDEGQRVKFVGKKLYINGKEYGKESGGRDVSAHCTISHGAIGRSRRALNYFLEH